MALLTCRECAEPVSTDAPACPSCGARTPTSAAHRRRQGTILGVFLAVALAIAVVVVLGLQRGQSSDELDVACAELNESYDGIPESMLDESTKDLLRRCQ